MATKRGNDLRKTASVINSEWLQNTLKSLGVAGKEMIKDMMPATAETISSGTRLATETAKNIRQNKVGMNTLQKALENNAVVKAGKDWYKNAVEDLKSGKLYNTDREGGDLFGMNDEDFSFDDLDFGDSEDENIDVNVQNNNYISSDSSAATLKTVDRQTTYQVQSAEKISNNIVAASAITVNKLSELSSGVISQLTSINSNLAGLLEYQNTNMTKFIDASIGYYEQMSNANKSSSDDSSSGSSTISSEDIFSSSGGLDLEQYKNYVLQNIKSTTESNGMFSMVKMAFDFLKDDYVNNPIGSIMKLGMTQLVPSVLKQSMEGFDTAFQRFIPVMLERLGNAGKGDNSTAGAIFRTIGKIFGIKVADVDINNKTFDMSKVKTGPMQYNGFANHSIVEIIPKYLRESNSYLKEIAQSVSGKSADSIKGNSEAFDWETGTYKTIDKIAEETFTSLNNRITAAFRTSDFGEALSGNKELLRSKEDQSKYSDALNAFYMMLAQESGPIDYSKPEVVANIVSKLGDSYSDDIKNLIQASIADLVENSQGGEIAAAAVAKQEASRSFQDATKRLSDSGSKGEGGQSSDHYNARLAFGNYDYQKWNEHRVASGLAVDYLQENAEKRRKQIEKEERERAQREASGVGGIFARVRNGITDFTESNDETEETPSSDSTIRRTDRSTRTGATSGIVRDTVRPSGLLGKPITSLVGKSLLGVAADIYNLLARGIYVKKKDIKDDGQQLLSGGEISETEGTIIETSTPTPSSPTPPTDNATETSSDATPSESVNTTATLEGTGALLRERRTAQAEKEAAEKANAGIADTAGGVVAGPFKFLSDMMNSIMAGNPEVFWDNVLNKIGKGVEGLVNKLDTQFFQPAKETILGKKDDYGYLKGGILEGVDNKARESYFKLRRMITGKGYVDAQGNKVEDATDKELEHTVVGQFKNIIGGVKDAIKERLFGTPASDSDDEDDEDKKKGIIPSFKSKLGKAGQTFLAGLVGWKHALFGTKANENEDTEKDGKQILKDMSAKVGEAVPTAITGTAAGGLLGMLVGGPIVGALVGFGGSLLSKSTKFTNWLFGEKDENGERTGGIISKNTQEYFKKNGKFLGGGAAIGLAKGLLTGGGLLGSIIGGPLAGIVTGVGTSMILKSEAFQKFMYGDPETGALGMKTRVKNWISMFGKDTETGDASGGKLLGMAGIGMAGGGMLGLIMGGPVLGASLGLGAAIIAQKDNFHSWLFGETDEYGNKREGILGQFKNVLMVKVFSPIIDSTKYIKDDAKSFFGEQIGLLGVRLGKLGDSLFGGLADVISDAKTKLGEFGNYLKNDFLKGFVDTAGKILSPIAKAATTVGEGIYSATKAVLSAPVKILGAITSPIAKAVGKTLSTITSVVTKTIDFAIVKPITNLVLKPLAFVTKTVGKIVAAPFKLLANVASTVTLKIEEGMAHISNFIHAGLEIVKDKLLHNPVTDWVSQRFKDVKEFGINVATFVKDAVLTPIRTVASSLIQTVGTAIKKRVSSFFNKVLHALNPLNWIKGAIRLITGKKSNEKKEPGDGFFGKIKDLWENTRPENSGRRIKDHGIYKYDPKTGKEIMVDSDQTNNQQESNIKAKRRDEKIAFKKQRSEAKQHQKNQNAILKWTGNQRTEDTEENRAIAEAAAAAKGIKIDWGKVDAIKTQTQKDEAKFRDKIVDKTGKIESDTDYIARKFDYVAGFLTGTLDKITSGQADIIKAWERSGSAVGRANAEARFAREEAEKTGGTLAKQNAARLSRRAKKTEKHYRKKESEIIAETANGRKFRDTASISLQGAQAKIAARKAAEDEQLEKLRREKEEKERKGQEAHQRLEDKTRDKEGTATVADDVNWTDDTSIKTFHRTIKREATSKLENNNIDDAVKDLIKSMSGRDIAGLRHEILADGTEDAATTDSLNKLKKNIEDSANKIKADIDKSQAENPDAVPADASEIYDTLIDRLIEVLDLGVDKEDESGVSDEEQDYMDSITDVTEDISDDTEAIEEHTGLLARLFSGFYDRFTSLFGGHKSTPTPEPSNPVDTLAQNFREHPVSTMMDVVEPVARAAVGVDDEESESESEDATIPAHAEGTSHAKKGPAVVGENGIEAIVPNGSPIAKLVGANGPEVVTLNEGDQVIPNSRINTTNISAGSGGLFAAIEKFAGEFFSDVDAILTSFDKKLSSTFESIQQQIVVNKTGLAEQYVSLSAVTETLSTAVDVQTREPKVVNITTADATINTDNTTVETENEVENNKNSEEAPARDITNLKKLGDIVLSSLPGYKLFKNVIETGKLIGGAASEAVGLVGDRIKGAYNTGKEIFNNAKAVITGQPSETAVPSFDEPGNDNEAVVEGITDTIDVIKEFKDGLIKFLSSRMQPKPKSMASGTDEQEANIIAKRDAGRAALDQQRIDHQTTNESLLAEASGKTGEQIRSQRAVQAEEDSDDAREDAKLAGITGNVASTVADTASKAAAGLGAVGAGIVDGLGGSNFHDKEEKENQAAIDEAAIAAEKNLTGQNLRKLRAAEAEEESDDAREDAKLKALQNLEVGQKSHNSIWDSIFSKKGLITGGLLLAAPLIFSLLKNVGPLLNLIGDALQNILSFVGDILGNMGKQFDWTNKNDARTNGETIIERAGDNVKQLADGNIIMMHEDGTASNQTTPRLKLLAKGATEGIISPVVAHLTGKAVKKDQEKLAQENLQKAVQKAVKEAMGETAEKNADDVAEVAMKKLGSEGVETVTKKKNIFSRAKDFFIRKGAKKGTEEAAEAGAKLAANSADDVAKAGTKLAANSADDIAKAGAKLAANTVDDVAKVGTKKGAKLVEKLVKSDNKILAKVGGWVDDVFKFITTKFSKKAGTKVGMNIFKFGPKKIMEVVTKYWKNIATKISEISCGRVSVEAASAGMMTAVFVGLAALDGLTGAAKLFHVDKKDVDWKMRAIATIIGALLGTLPGAIFDVINGLVFDVLGIDVLNSIATALYNLWSDEEGKQVLAASQQKFQDKYVDYQDEEITKQYETQKAAGMISAEMTKEEFAEKAHSGEIGISYKSFADYNTEKNASMMDKVTSGVGKGIKAIGKGLGKAKNFLFGGKEEAYYYDEATGNKFTKNDDGTYSVINKDGKNLGYVAQDAIPQTAQKVETEKKGIIPGAIDAVNNSGVAKVVTAGAKKLGSLAGKGLKAAGSVLGSAAKGIGSFFSTVGGKVKGIVGTLTKKGGSLVGSLAGKAFKSIKGVLSKVGKGIGSFFSGIFGGIKNISGTVSKNGGSITSLADKAVKGIGSVFGKAANGVKSLFSNIFGGKKNDTKKSASKSPKASPSPSPIKSVKDLAKNGVKVAAKAATGKLTIKDVKELIKSGVVTAKSGSKLAKDIVVNNIKSKVNTAKSAGKLISTGSKVARSLAGKAAKGIGSVIKKDLAFKKNIAKAGLNIAKKGASLVGNTAVNMTKKGLGMQIAATKAGLNLGKKGLQLASKGIKAAGTVTGDVTKGAVNLAKKGINAKRAVDKAIVNTAVKVGKNAGSLAIKGGKFVGNTAINMAKGAGNLAKKGFDLELAIGKAIGTTLLKGGKAATTAVGNIAGKGAKTAGTVAGNAVKGAVNLVNGAGSLIKKDIEFKKNIAKTGLNIAKKGISAVGSGIGKGVRAVGGIAKGVGGAAVKGAKAVGSFFSNVFGGKKKDESKKAQSSAKVSDKKSADTAKSATGKKEDVLQGILNALNILTGESNNGGILHNIAKSLVSMNGGDPNSIKVGGKAIASAAMNVVKNSTLGKAATTAIKGAKNIATAFKKGGVKGAAKAVGKGISKVASTIKSSGLGGVVSLFTGKNKKASASKTSAELSKSTISAVSAGVKDALKTAGTSGKLAGTKAATSPNPIKGTDTKSKTQTSKESTLDSIARSLAIIAGEKNKDGMLSDFIKSVDKKDGKSTDKKVTPSKSPMPKSSSSSASSKTTSKEKGKTKSGGVSKTIDAANELFSGDRFKDLFKSLDSEVGEKDVTKMIEKVDKAVASLDKKSTSGDLSGMLKTKVDKSGKSDQTLMGKIAALISEPLLMISKIKNLPTTVMSNINNKNKSGSDDVTKSVAKDNTNVSNAVKNVNKFSKSGNISGLLNTKIPEDRNNPISGFTKAILEQSKVIQAPIAVLKTQFDDISSSMNGMTDKIKPNSDALEKSKKQMATNAKSGKIDNIISSKLNVNTNDPMSDIWKAMFNVGKVASSSMAIMNSSSVVDAIAKSTGSDTGIAGGVIGGLKTVVDTGKSIVTSIISNAGSFAKNAFNNVMSFFGGKGTGTKKKTVNIGGKGESNIDDTLNGVPYYSQNDSRWSNKKFLRSDKTDDGATMSDTGCGPTAMSMVINSMNSGLTNPVELADMATNYGYRDESGTNWEFIGDSARSFGINSARIVSPDANTIRSAVSLGNPVVMLGQDSQTDSNSPYTSSGHYVVGTGVNSSGDIIYSDPRGKSYSGTVPASNLANQTSSMWLFDNTYGGNGIGRKVKHNHRKRKTIYGGRGVDTSKWISIILAVKSESYKQNLKYDKSGNTYTKITINGKTYSMRPDCSGFVSTCLKFYGVFSNSDNPSAKYLMPSQSGGKKLKAAGFTWRSFTSWDKLNPGDIVVAPGYHTEIFAYKKNGKHYSYSGGSRGINKPDVVQSADSSGELPKWKAGGVWSPGPPGKNAISSTGSIANYGGSGNTTSTSTQPANLVAVAQKEVGTKEISNNYTKYHDWYYGSKKSVAWCCIFVSYCANKAGIPKSIIPKDASCTSMASKILNLGGKQVAFKDARAGDLAFFKKSGGGYSHIGIVEYNSNGTVHMIEGNCSNMVKKTSAVNGREKWSPKRAIVIIRPKYSTSSVAAVEGAANNTVSDATSGGSLGTITGTASNRLTQLMELFSTVANRTMTAIATGDTKVDWKKELGDDTSSGNGDGNILSRTIHRVKNGVNNIKNAIKGGRGITTYSYKKDGEKQLSPHFKVKNFRSKDGANEIKIDSKLVDSLETIRNHFNSPLTINSGYRSPAYNARVGGVKNSEHTQGRASDIVVKGKTPLQVATYANDLNMGGIGLYGGFTHVDTRSERSRWKHKSSKVSNKTYTAQVENKSKSSAKVTTSTTPTPSTSTDTITTTTTPTSSSAADVFSNISNVFSVIGNTLFDAVFNGEKTVDWNKSFSDSTGDTISTSSAASTGTSATNTSADKIVTEYGKTTEQQIWTYLRKELGMTEAGAAGLMGNLEAESSLKPNNLEGKYEKKLGYNDDSYTKAVDSGKYSKEKFMNDHAGYGLAQWTYWSRKKALYEFAKKKGTSIANIASQLGYLNKELSNGYKGVLSTLKSTNSLSSASNAVMLKFERPTNQSVSNQQARAKRGKKYYDKFKGKLFSANSGSGDGIESILLGGSGTKKSSAKLAAQKAIAKRKAKASIKKKITAKNISILKSKNLPNTKNKSTKSSSGSDIKKSLSTFLTDAGKKYEDKKTITTSAEAMLSKLKTVMDKPADTGTPIEIVDMSSMPTLNDRAYETYSGNIGSFADIDDAAKTQIFMPYATDTPSTTNAINIVNGNTSTIDINDITKMLGMVITYLGNITANTSGLGVLNDIHKDLNNHSSELIINQSTNKASSTDKSKAKTPSMKKDLTSSLKKSSDTLSSAEMNARRIAFGN